METYAPPGSLLSANLQAEKIHEAQLRGLRAAEEKTKLTLFRPIEAKKRERA
jgi:hypothetical protein